MTIEQYLICISITWFIVKHKTSKKFHYELFHKAFRLNGISSFTLQEPKVVNKFLALVYELLTCAFCVGFWVGIIGECFTVNHHTNIFEFAGIGFINAILSVIACAISKE